MPRKRKAVEVKSEEIQHTEAPTEQPTEAVAVLETTPPIEKAEERSPIVGLSTVNLTDSNDGPKARLMRHQKFQQMAMRFDEKPAPEIVEQLRENGWKWRGSEGVWTIQLDPEKKWQTHAEAEKLFKKLTDEIRVANGCCATLG